MERVCLGCGAAIEAVNIKYEPDGSVEFDCHGCGVRLWDNPERTALRLAGKSEAATPKKKGKGRK